MDDILKISSDMFRGLLSKSLSKIIKKKTGITTDMIIRNLEITNKDENENLIVKISVEAAVSSNDLKKQIEKLL